MATKFSPKTLSYLVNDVCEWGTPFASERGDTVELLNEVIKLENPIDRVCTEQWRKMNIGFAITDALSHIVGDSSLHPLTQFVPQFEQYSTNKRTIDGSYGERIHTNEQLQLVIDLLKRTPETRRAVITIYMGPVDLAGGGGLNTPCTLNMHFLVRDGKLNMTVMMRSNDVILGLTNDVFTFTMLHEYVSVNTGIPLGDYTHFASSLHIYKSDMTKYKTNTITGGYWPGVMSKMPEKWNPSNLYYMLSGLHKTTFENAMDAEFEYQYEINLYLASAAVYFRKHKLTDRMLRKIDDITLRRVASFWTGDMIP